VLSVEPSSRSPQLSDQVGSEEEDDANDGIADEQVDDEQADDEQADGEQANAADDAPMDGDDEREDGEDDQGHITMHKRLAYAVISQMVRLPRRHIKFPRDVCAKRVRDVFRFRGLRFDPASGVPRCCHVLVRSFVINTLIQWIRMAGMERDTPMSENELRHQLEESKKDWNEIEHEAFKKMARANDDADVHGKQSLTELLLYSRDISDHTIRRGCAFEPLFPGSLVSSWQKEHFRWRTPLAVVWVFDRQAHSARNDSQTLSAWQKSMPLLPMYTFTVAGDGDCMMHSAILADSCIIERLTKPAQPISLASATTAAGAAQPAGAADAAAAEVTYEDFDRPGDVGTKNVPPLKDIATTVLDATRSATNGRVLSESAQQVSGALHSLAYRAQLVITAHHALCAVAAHAAVAN